MPIKPITDWKDPIWEQQKGESDRANFYRNQFEKMNCNITAFSRLVLKESIRSQKGHRKVTEIEFLKEDASFNEKHVEDIELYIKTDGKKGKPCKPSYRTIADWAKFHEWKNRRVAFKAKFKEDVIQEVADNIVAKLSEIADLELENALLNLENQKSKLQQGNYSEYKIKAQAETNKLLQDSLLGKVNPFEKDEIEDENNDEIPANLNVPNDPEFEKEELQDNVNEILKRYNPT